MESMTLGAVANRGAPPRRSATFYRNLGRAHCVLHVHKADVLDSDLGAREVERADSAGRVDLSTTALGEPAGPAFTSPPRKDAP